ncbi:hypothetical protein GpartN1_g3085.t1 [Galdieria partita]|uniref:Transmembrane protein 14 n=1 Tax=Galdieria partita TaxID=83374 RepID=A0A9C7PVR2_9RHOD|nr:hypothetical protein GpartN1_g3085.t1 [Galdieria partita]
MFKLAILSKSFTSLFYKPEQFLRKSTIFTRYQKFSIASLKDLNSIPHTVTYKEYKYGKTDILSSTKTQGAHKVVRRRLFHNAAASSGVSIPDLWSSVTLTYGSLIAAGGITGYVRTRSIPSLLSGVVSAVLLFVSWRQNSPPLAFAVSSFLTVAFFIRFQKTKKMYPSGILGVISLSASAFFGYVSYWT